jgi:hypothetical protein
MKKKVGKKLALHRETLLNLKQVAGGLAMDNQDRVATDTDGDTFPSGGGMICWISDCNACETELC